MRKLNDDTVVVQLTMDTAEMKNPPPNAPAPNAEILPPDPEPTQPEMEAAANRGMMWVINAALQDNKELTLLKARAIIDIAKVVQRNKFGGAGKSSHQILING